MTVVGFAQVRLRALYHHTQLTLYTYYASHTIYSSCRVRLIAPHILFPGHSVMAECILHIRRMVRGAAKAPVLFDIHAMVIMRYRRAPATRATDGSKNASIPQRERPESSFKGERPSRSYNRLHPGHPSISSPEMSPFLAEELHI